MMEAPDPLAGFATKERSRITGQGDRLPVALLIGLALDTTAERKLEVLSERLQAEVAQFKHRQRRRREGVQA